MDASSNGPMEKEHTHTHADALRRAGMNARTDTLMSQLCQEKNLTTKQTRHSDNVLYDWYVCVCVCV